MMARPDGAPGRVSGAGAGVDVSRRALLSGIGGSGLFALVSSGCTSEPAPAGELTVAAWRAQRGKGFLIGHRGAGDVVPEHTLEAYEAALAWGAKALEISVVQTSDSVLVCHHDLTFDRTTNLSGTVSKLTWEQVSQGRMEVPRLGPGWSGERAPRLSRLEDVLQRVGGRAVLFVEAKDNAAFPAMVELIERLRLKESVVLKLHSGSPRFAEAKEAGYPVFGYQGSFAEATPARIRQLAKLLDPATDYLVVPSNENGTWLPDPVLRAAVATKVPVLVFEVHRRSELKHHLARGAVGAVVSSIGYLNGAAKPVDRDAWAQGRLAPGEMTRRPESSDYALGWPPGGAVSLRVQDRQAFVTLGQFAPLRQPTGPYQVDLEVRVDVVPSQPRSNVTLAFAHADDRYYEHRQGTLDGYHALLRIDGSLELWSHSAGTPDGTPLGPPAAGPPPAPGAWTPLRLEVTPTTLTWTRLDTGASVTASDTRWRGDYLHVGRSAIDGSVSLRRMRIS